MNDFTNYEDIIIEEDGYLNPKLIADEFDNELLNYAIYYSKSGYPVFPIHNIVKRYGVLQCSCLEGINCPHSGKHPRTHNGFKAATTNINQVITWWEQYPNANIGLLTGEESGIFVLDIDIKTEATTPYNGEITLEEMQDYYKSLMKGDFEPLPETLTAISGSGCRHLYFKYDLDFPSKTLHSKVGSAFGLGLDIKSDDGYIIAPPSNHKSGNKYQWLGVNTPIEDAPKWLNYEIQKVMEVKLTKKQESARQIQNVSSKSYNGEIYQVGKRNDHFHKYVCGLVNSHSKEEVLRFARKFNNERCNPPLTETEIISTVNWAWNKFVLRKDKGLPLKK
jgi:putative DNA primase/helicase